MSSNLELQHQILTRLLADDALFARFLADPEAALADFNAPPHLINALRDTVKTQQDAQQQLALIESALGRETEETPPPNPQPPPDRKGLDDLLEETPPEESGEAGLESEQTPPQRVVNTGMAAADTPERPLNKAQTLEAGGSYYFWLEVGEPLRQSMEATPTPLPTESLPPEAVLQVVLFGNSDEPQLLTGATQARIRVAPDGSATVQRVADTPFSLLGNPALRRRRLFFAVQMPAQPGAYHLRCNIYFEQTLLQSRYVTLHATAVSQPQDGALRSVLDYNISHSLNGRHLQAIGQHTLSILVNDNGSDTHGFRFFGADEQTHNAHLSEGQVKNLIEKSRNVMRQAAWGFAEPFDPALQDGRGQPKHRYRYGRSTDRQHMQEDLISFALQGYSFYHAIIDQFTGSVDASDELAALMRRPGRLQIATRQAVSLIIPAALFYDYPLDDGAFKNELTVCPHFLQSLDQPAPLAETDCFQGNCPTRDEMTVVCPSGFWGYRHSLGMPVSIGTAADAPATIAAENLTIATSVSTDPDFVQRLNHERALQQMGVGWEHADTRDESIALLKQTKAQLVYYYCHGGYDQINDKPYLSLGPKNSRRFTSALIRASGIRWRDIRPLVFINGCHTTNLSPDKALDFVSAFVQVAQAAGVIGTEITIFEPIAVAFAEACLQQFLVERQSIGDSVRSARLDMLKANNPLGLVYVPFVMAGLKLV